MDTRTIFLVGKPGSGKGDQGRLLAKATGWKIISSSGELRAFAAEGTSVGQKVMTDIDAGILTPPWLVTHLFLKALFELKQNESVIFDGFCRKVPEAELDIAALRWIDRPFTVIHLKVSDEEIKHRLSLRKEIEARADDNVVDERLKEYREYTEPAIEKFREAGNLIEINGERTREEIAVDINVALGLVPSTGR